MGFERQTRRGKVLEILEFSCPYGYSSHDEDTLRTVYTRQTEKYQELARELRRIRHQPVNVTAMIVSSMGAVYGPSLKLLGTILGCSDREIRRLGQRMSDPVTMGSLKMWHETMRNREQGVTYGETGDALMAQESQEMNALDVDHEGTVEREDDDEDDETE
jgi:hypothetical protein